MIYFSGIDSLVECSYLGEGIGDSMRTCDIFVNPHNITYLAKKTVIVTSPSYPLSNIELLLKHGNKVVSRIAIDLEGIVYNPYIIRPQWSIMWSGEILEKVKNTEDLLEDCVYSQKTNLLLFPKIKESLIPLKDKKGNLSWIGWALHQVGQNIENNSPFLDLELLKTKKMQLLNP